MALDSRKTRPFRVLVSGDETDGKYSEVMLCIEPKEGPPLHTHTKEAETFIPMGGRFRIYVGDQSPVEIGPGQEAYGPRGIPHRFENIGDTDGVLIVKCEPAGFEHSFNEYWTARNHSGLEGDALLAEIKRIDLKYGQVIDRDPKPKTDGDN
jgi:mannose-6-phosphate isomerase-like protein (cupin superfamily)